MQAQKDSNGATWGLALLFALLLGGMQSSVAGVLVGAVLGAVVAQVMQLRAKSRQLEEQLRSLQAAAARSREDSRQLSVAQTPEQPVVDVDPRLTPAATIAAPSPTPVRVSEPAPVTASAPIPAPRAQTAVPPRPAPQPAQPSWFDNLIESAVTWIKGGNPLARVGIVILFFGGAFLAKYAAENSLFPIELRFVAIALGAFALLFIGWRLRERSAVYAQLLQGGGVAGLYLTVYAATGLFKLLPFGFALALLIVIAIAAAILAVAQNALSLAVIATAGGFLAPILVSSGSNNHVALFTYFAVLNLGVFAVAWFRTWRLLNVLGFVFTFTITGLWRATGYAPADLFTADAFLILFFLMYVAVSILSCLRQPPDLKGYVSGSLVFGLPVVAFSLHATLIARIEYGLAWSALALGAFYLMLAWTLFLSRRSTLRLLVEAFAALGVIFASLAIPLAFDTRITAAMWAVEGAGLLWLGVRQNRRLARAFATLLQLAAGLGYLSGLDHLSSGHAVFNSAYLGALMLAVSGILSAYWLFRNREQQSTYERGADVVFTLWGVAWLLFGGLQEINRFALGAELGAALSYVTLLSVLLTLTGARLHWPLPKQIALFLPALSMLSALIYATSHSHPFTQWAVLGWPAILAVHYGLLYRSDQAGRNPLSCEWLHACAVWAIALVLAWEVNWQVEFVAGGVWPHLSWGLAPALLLGWIARRPLSPAWPLAKFADVYRVRGAVPLGIACVAWIVIINLGSDGDARWLPYVPLLNPLDISVALCGAALALWWTALSDTQRLIVWPADPKTLLGVVAAIAFLWLNAALLRSLHHLWGTPLGIYGMAHSTTVQTALSVFWGLLGFMAMTVAAKKHWRYVWIVGGVLMVVVVAKLFLVDLSSIGTLARITSFLSVGVLLLVTGYLAPLPPRRASQIETES